MISFDIVGMNACPLMLLVVERLDPVHQDPLGKELSLCRRLLAFFGIHRLIGLRED